MSAPGTPHVLVVDDSAVVRQAFSALLTAAGFTVDVAADPIFARARMARARPNAIVLEVAMPRMDGLTFPAAAHGGAGSHPGGDVLEPGGPAHSPEGVTPSTA